jgi:glycosyltransferase involved in cell wall biosynthesis
MNVLFIGTLSGAICGELKCNLKVADALRASSCVSHLYLVSSTISDFREDKIGGFKFSKLISMLKIYILFFRYLFSGVNVVYLTPGLTVMGLLRFVPLILFSRLLNKRIVCHFHGSRLTSTLQHKYFGKLFSSLLNSCDALIFLSDTLRTNNKKYLNLDKCLVSPNSLSAEWFAQNEISKSSTSTNFLYLSNFIPEKGVFEVIKAHQALSAKNATLFIAGTGDESVVADIKAMIADDHSIVFVGAIDGQEKIDLYRQSHYFVFPTRYDQEAFPLVVLEAMASDCIVISTSVGAIPEVLNYGDCGCLLASTDSLALIESIQRITLDSSLQKRYLEQSKIAVRQYQDSVVLNRLIATILGS